MHTLRSALTGRCLQDNEMRSSEMTLKTKAEHRPVDDAKGKIEKIEKT